MLQVVRVSRVRAIRVARVLSRIVLLVRWLVLVWVVLSVGPVVVSLVRWVASRRVSCRVRVVVFSRCRIALSRVLAARRVALVLLSVVVRCVARVLSKASVALGMARV